VNISSIQEIVDRIKILYESATKLSDEITYFDDKDNIFGNRFDLLESDYVIYFVLFSKFQST